jgi:predicted enzyme related to lactoylglutathione lyase
MFLKQRQRGRLAKMLQGLRTIVYPVSDPTRAKAWYSELVGKEPYFDEPFYIGFNVGGFELGLDPNGRVPGSPGEGPITYWGVADITSALQRMQELGAERHSAIQDVGGGIKVASIYDPFGNVVGIIENPNFRPGQSE